MADKNRSQQDQQRQSNVPGQQRGSEQQQGNRSNVSNQEDQFENPQEGSQWENYRTRELKGNEERSSDQDVSQKDRNR